MVRVFHLLLKNNFPLRAHLDLVHYNRSYNKIVISKEQLFDCLVALSLQRIVIP